MSSERKYALHVRAEVTPLVLLTLRRVLAKHGHMVTAEPIRMGA